jgi:hypothetical protein
MFVGNDPGALVPKNTAWSRHRPNASVSSGIDESQMFWSTSARTLSGTGMMTAISSMFKNLFDQLTSVVCLRPVSPPTQ